MKENLVLVHKRIELLIKKLEDLNQQTALVENPGCKPRPHGHGVGFTRKKSKQLTGWISAVILAVKNMSIWSSRLTANALAIQYLKMAVDVILGMAWNCFLNVGLGMMKLFSLQKAQVHSLFGYEVAVIDHFYILKLQTWL